MHILVLVALSIFGSSCNAIRVPIDYTNSTSTSNDTQADANIQRRFGGFWAIQNNEGPHNPNFRFPANGPPKAGRGNQPQRPPNNPKLGQRPQNNRPAQGQRPQQPQAGNSGKRLPNQNGIHPWHPSYMLRPGRAEQKYNTPLGKSIPVVEEVDEGKQAGRNPNSKPGGWWDKNNPRPKARSARQAVIFPDDEENALFPPFFQALRPTPPSTTTEDSAVTGTSTMTPCERSCPVTPEFNPICSSDGTTYTNMGRMKCAQNCGKPITLLYHGSCRPQRRSRQ